MFILAKQSGAGKGEFMFNTTQVQAILPYGEDICEVYMRDGRMYTVTIKFADLVAGIDHEDLRDVQAS